MGLEVRGLGKGANDTIMLQLTSKSVEGRIPDISKGDFEFMGAIIEADRLR
jgi:hypothetical protein